MGQKSKQTWSVRKEKKKESKRDVPVSVRESSSCADGAMMRGESDDPICIVSTSCWRREEAARGCRNGDPQGSRHVGCAGDWDEHVDGGK